MKLSYKVIDHQGSGHWMVCENGVYCGITVYKSNGRWTGYIGPSPVAKDFKNRERAAQEALKVREARDQTNSVLCSSLDSHYLHAQVLHQRLVDTRDKLIASLKGKDKFAQFSSREHQLTGVLNFLVDELAGLGCHRGDLSRRFGWEYIQEHC